MIKPYRHLIAGWLIFLMIAVTLTTGFGVASIKPLYIWISGGAAWLAAFLLFVDTSRVLKIQVLLILSLGCTLIAYAQQHDGAIDVQHVVGSSTGLMTMIASVGFLRLVVVPPGTAAQLLPRGRQSFLRTLFGLNVAASVINVSAPIIVADRIHAERPLQRFSAQCITRVFCGVSSWSPFFGAMAVVLTYVKGAELLPLMIAGFPFMLIGFIAVYLEAHWRYAHEVDGFVGYPMHASALLVPALLVITVLTLSATLEGNPILALIAASALLVTGGVLLARSGTVSAARDLFEFVATGLPRIVNELCLFLAAGVLAAGISAMLTLGVFDNPFAGFDGTTAAQVLAIIVLCGGVGIHPIIMISSFSPMLLSLDPNPTLLAATYLYGWHLGTCANPLSGTNLVFQGRYGIASWRLALWNWPYAAVMLSVGAVGLNSLGEFLL
ncbi:MAG: hypothetical protein AAF420_04110 [Pseudomonadota bacterium]